MGIKVKLLKRKISKGRFSLYLDYYPGYTDFKTGKFIRRKFLKMYVFEEPKSHEKTHNKNMLNLAQLICQKEENRVNRPEIYSDFEKEQIKRQEIGEQNFWNTMRNNPKKEKVIQEEVGMYLSPFS